MNYNKFLRLVERGQRGDALWIPLGFPKMGKHVGVAKYLYHLIGADPGVGKTSLVDVAYVLNTYKWYLENRGRTDAKLKIFYYSLERSSEFKSAKWTALKLWEDHRILVDVPTILGWGSSRRKLTSREIELINGPYKDYFQRMQDEVISVIDEKENPTGVYKHMFSWGLSNGTVYRRTRDGILQKIDYQKWKNNSSRPQAYWVVPQDQDECEVEPGNKRYIPDDEKLITTLVIDRLGKLRMERDHSKKQNIDKMSEYCTDLRDIFGHTIVAINQFNRNASDIKRRVHTDLTPEEQDFKNSSNMYEDADVVLGVFDPWKYGIDNHMKYNITKCVNDEGYDRFRSISILKNSYGIANAGFGFQFIGECGYYNELKKADQMTDLDYRKLRNPNQNIAE